VGTCRLDVKEEIQVEMESGQKHPIGMYTLSITALFQNFGFWGVVSFFPLYLTGEYQYSEADATIAYGVFLGIATALPLLGGYASAYLKQYSISILLASLCLVVGCVLLSLNIASLLPFSLGSVSLGYGFFWPAVLALQGRLYDSRESLRDGGFSIFYAVSSSGILLTQTVSSLVLQAYGWAPLYLTLAVAGLLGITSFFLSYRHYRSVDSAIFNSAKPASKPLTTTDRKRITSILILAVFSIIFWMGCSQMGSSVLFFSKNFVHRHLLGFEVPPTVFLSFFALTVVIMGPVMAIFWRFLSQTEIQLSAPRKMAISLILLALSFVVIAIAAMGLVGDEAKGNVNPIYLLVFYFLQACAVIIMAPIGFAFVTKWAPMEWTGRLIGVWFSATGLGSFLGGYAKNVIDNVLSPLYLYEVFFLVIFCAAIGLLAINRLIIKMVGQESYNDIN
jgi:POT family proton-dependent oligopeptide transporter